MPYRRRRGYDCFEALEAEFDRFNEYYPDVELVFIMVNDYNNMIGTVLNGNDTPTSTSLCVSRSRHAS